MTVSVKNRIATQPVSGNLARLGSTGNEKDPGIMILAPPNLHLHEDGTKAVTLLRPTPTGTALRVLDRAGRVVDEVGLGVGVILL